MAARIITDEQIEALDRLLQLRAVPFGGLGIEGLDGFMSALQAGPGAPVVGDAFDSAWGPQPPRWESEADRGEALALFEALWETVARRLRHDGESLPPALLPIWWMPEDPEAEHPDDTPIGAAWAEGFRLGSERETETWQAWLEETDWLHDAFALIDDLEVGTTFDEDGETERPLRYRERLDAYASLADLLFDLQQHRIERLTPREPVRAAPLPGRNDPCPCGSGRKFKQCCGSGKLDA